LGGRRTIKVDARVLALTNVYLKDAVDRRDFREDLFYRLNVVHIEVPPLRDRKRDLPELVRSFLKTYSQKHGRSVNRIAPAVLRLLQEYDFPGNVRELANTIERAVIVAGGKRIEESDLPEAIRTAVITQQRRARPRTLADIETAYVSEVLQATNGNKTEAARILGISRKNLYERLARQK
jgi:DNA-binding NtrC family response regulator